MYRIIEVKNRNDMKRFVKFPLRLYKKCPYYVPSLYGDEMQILNPKKNLSLGTSEVRAFICLNEKNRVVGRIAAIINHDSNDKNNEKYIRFSRIDMINDKEVTKLLLEEVKKWGRERGLTVIQGPWGFNDTDREGMLSYGFDEYSTYATAYSFPYYIEHFEELGYEKESEWIEYRLDYSYLDERYTKIHDALKEQGYRDLCETMKPGEIIKKYAKSFFDCYNKAYADLDNFVPVDDKSMKAVIQTFAVLINGRYFSVIVNKDDEVVAFCVGLPYIGHALNKAKGHLVRALPGILKAKRNPRKIELALIGVDPAYRNSGVHALGITRFALHAQEDQLDDMFFDPTLTTNHKMLNTFNATKRSLRCKRQTFRQNID